MSEKQCATCKYWRGNMGYNELLIKIFPESKSHYTCWFDAFESGKHAKKYMKSHFCHRPNDWKKF